MRVCKPPTKVSLRLMHISWFVQPSRTGGPGSTVNASPVSRKWSILLSARFHVSNRSSGFRARARNLPTGLSRFNRSTHHKARTSHLNYYSGPNLHRPGPLLHRGDPQHFIDPVQRNLKPW